MLVTPTDVTWLFRQDARTLACMTGWGRQGSSCLPLTTIPAVIYHNLKSVAAALWAVRSFVADIPKHHLDGNLGCLPAHQNEGALPASMFAWHKLQHVTAAALTPQGGPPTDFAYSIHSQATALSLSDLVHE